ncbi:DMT family transporter [Demequina sp.]|uniref:DMT family transporter n=1 Tax=Demequina sp. TaxID=2050685 RepID=UPI003D1105A3
MRTRDFLFAVAAACLWGGGGVVGVLFGEREHLEPVGIATWRMALAGLSLLLVVLFIRGAGPRSWTRPMWVRMLVTGALTAGFEYAFFTSVTLASVGLATLIGIGSAPVVVAGYDAVVTRSRPPARSVVALGLSLSGLLLLVGGSIGQGSSMIAGSLVALVSGVTFAAITIVNRTPVPRLHPVALTGGAFTSGAIMLLPFAIMAHTGMPDDVAGWALAVALGVGITGLAYVLFLTALQTVPPFVATIVTLLEPLLGAILGAIVFGERLGVLGVIGGALMGTAILLLRPQRDEPETIH